ncbi:MAG: hypothetical protein FRX49_10822 [Trebouxia sp. A1-2]|nr:MAG: hypothetical protein FRX49_10822 [Trebouxia sp. A1-2]
MATKKACILEQGSLVTKAKDRVDKQQPFCMRGVAMLLQRHLWCIREEVYRAAWLRATNFSLHGWSAVLPLVEKGHVIAWSRQTWFTDTTQNPDFHQPYVGQVQSFLTYCSPWAIGTPEEREMQVAQLAWVRWFGYRGRNQNMYTPPVPVLPEPVLRRVRPDFRQFYPASKLRPRFYPSPNTTATITTSSGDPWHFTKYSFLCFLDHVVQGLLMHRCHSQVYSAYAKADLHSQNLLDFQLKENESQPGIALRTDLRRKATSVASHLDSCGVGNLSYGIHDCPHNLSGLGLGNESK